MQKFVVQTKKKYYSQITLLDKIEISASSPNFDNKCYTLKKILSVTHILNLNLYQSHLCFSTAI